MRRSSAVGDCPFGRRFGLPLRWAMLVLAASGFLLRPVRASDTDLQEWSSLALSGLIARRWRASLEVQTRWVDDIRHSERIGLRPTLAYQVRPGLTAGVGLVWQHFANPAAPDEYRPTEFVQYQHPLGKLTLSHRGALEQRTFGDGSPVIHRYRQQLKLAVPLNHDQRWEAVASAEAIFNLNAAGARADAGFERERFYAGLRRTIGKHWKLEGGYQFDHIDSPQDRPNVDIGAIRTILTYNW